MEKTFFKKTAAFSGCKVLVWGDIILDEYIYTNSSRVSREAPVLITEFESDRFILGGAGNVLLNIKELGGEPIPVGFIGRNPTGDLVRLILEEKGITTSALIEMSDYDTPRKTRIMSGGEHTKKQQVLRVDRINKKPISSSDYGRLEKILIQYLQQVDLLLISDYIFQSVNPLVYKKLKDRFPSKIYLIDSREHFDQFGGASFFTPNEPEMRRLFYNHQINTEEDFIKPGNDLMERLDLDGLVLKRGQEGMLVFKRNKPLPEKIDVYGSTDIVDVTGAGDTVISVISLGLLSGLNIFESARLANIAAGLVVMREGAYPISYRELSDEFKKIQ